MKNITYYFLTIILSFSTFQSFSQWNENGNNQTTGQLKFLGNSGTGIIGTPNGWTRMDPNGNRFIITVKNDDVNQAKNILDIENTENSWKHMMELKADGSAFFLGNVGIGTTSSQIKLHLKTTNTNSEILRLDGGTRTTSLLDYSDGTYNNAGLQFKKNSTVGQFKFSNNNGDLLTIKASGRLHISNTNLNSELLTLDGGTRTTSIINYSDGTYDNAGLQFKKNSTVGQFKFSNNNGDLMTIRSNGNVGIGTSNTFGYKLAVNGTIGSTEVKVENTSAWPDFVFEKEYKLATLEEVENHIIENGHLPEIPSEKEVTENGINLGEMNAKLLQKIEELTLYLIEQNKEMNAMKEEIEQIKNK